MERKPFTMVVMNNNHSEEEKITMQKFFTIRADVRGSTKNKKYRELQKVVSDVNSELSLMFNDAKLTLIEMTVRAGDELFAIYRSEDVALEALQLLLVAAKTYKVPLYIGCGNGELEDESEDENLVNGVSIWRATKALENVSKGKPKYNEKLISNIVLKVYLTDDDKINMTYQTLFYLLSEKVLKRTSQQNKAVILLKKYPKKEYNVLFNLLTDQVVEDDSGSKEDKKNKFNKYLQRAEYHIVNDLTEVIKNNIKGVDM